MNKTLSKDSKPDILQLLSTDSDIKLNGANNAVWKRIVALNEDEQVK